MNSLGKVFCINIYGESHGEEIGVLIDNCPSGIDLTEQCFLEDINRRAAGKNGTTKRIEKDIPFIKSGVYKQKTTGSPILISFKNENTISGDYDFDGFFRPGHADFAANRKYKGYNNPEGGGHFSGRLTLPIVAAGVIAKKIISDIEISSEIIEIGGQRDYESYLQAIENEGDSLGGIIKCNVKNLPVGLGEPFFYSIESALSSAIFSIPGVKAVEFGEGIKAASSKGSEHNDLYIDKYGRTKTNNSGGISGGISNGNDIVFTVYCKPTPSIGKEQHTFNFKDEKIDKLNIKGRHDVCYALRVPVVVEALTAIVLADFHLLSK